MLILNGVLALITLLPAVILLERTHRRTRDLPRVPFGFDAESEAAAGYRRQLAELRYQLTLTEADSGAGTRSDGTTRLA